MLLTFKVKAWSITKNKLRYSLRHGHLLERPHGFLKTESVTDSVTVIYSKRPEVLLKTDSATALN